MSDNRLCPFCELPLSVHRSAGFGLMPTVICDAAPRDVITFVQPVTEAKVFAPGSVFDLGALSAPSLGQPYRDFAEALLSGDLEKAKQAVDAATAMSAQRQNAAYCGDGDDSFYEHGFKGDDETVATWTCERGCGYDGNTAERVACEVCARGRGD
jgi:hypothetical protein